MTWNTRSRCWCWPCFGYSLFSTAEDLAGLRYLSRSAIEKVISELVECGYAGTELMGHALGQHHRSFLLPNGVQAAMRYWGVPDEWQTGDDTLRVLHGCLPLIEVANNLLPRLWRSQAVRTPAQLAVGPKDEPHFVIIDENVWLCRLIWVRAYGRSIDALEIWPESSRWVEAFGQ